MVTSALECSQKVSRAIISLPFFRAQAFSFLVLSFVMAHATVFAITKRIQAMRKAKNPGGLNLALIHSKVKIPI